ncbi:MAG: cytochrome c [Bacteroidota bacterium]
MHLRNSLILLQAAILAILFLLSLVAGYTLALNQASEPVNEMIHQDVEDKNEQSYQQVKQGKTLWNANSCGACHNKNMKDDATAPALGGVEDRWADYPREDLYNFIRNNGKLIASGHERATEIYLEWNRSAMNLYPNLTDEDIEALLSYIDAQYTSRP